jgi:2-polyprenyl-3-methyl-5-hydroxy-6-metoxy-1,4-benzoquinol methylase
MTNMKNLYKTPLNRVIKRLKNKLKTTKSKETVAFKALNPDIATSLYNGNIIRVNNEDVIYRGYKSWLDLAQILHCRMLTPQLIDENFVMIRYEKLNPDSSFHQVITDKEEKYGQDSIFSEIHKNEETAFIYYYMQALENVKIDTRVRILNLGVNSGDEFEAIETLSENFADHELVGIDYCQSAINAAKEKFKRSKNITFYAHDINRLNELNLGEFDLIISIGTLQSSNLEFNKLLMSIVQNQLKRSGAIILGFPNCRWIDGEMIYGARVKNYPFSEMGLLYKDVIFTKKYLQQKKYRVTITGKDYIFLTATSIR